MPVPEGADRQVVPDPGEFRRTLDDCSRRMPAVFPAGFAQAYGWQDDRVSLKRGRPIRRIPRKDGTASSIRPSFLMPSLTARTQDVEGPLFLRKFGGPSWALARAFGDDPRDGDRLGCGLGRSSVVGTTARRAELPEPRRADEPHQPRDGQRVYVATTVGGGCGLGAEPAKTAGPDDLKAAYGAFKAEARDVAPQYAPRTVNTDGGKGPRAAWEALFQRVVILRGVRHAWLKIRDRAKHLGEGFAEVSRPVWEAYPAPDRRCFGQRLRWRRRWATGHLTGIVLEGVVDLRAQRPRWSSASRHPGGYRTSHRLDRLMRGRDRYFDQGQPRHGSLGACRRHCRAWALLGNFGPWHPATARENCGWRCPAERLNRHRYPECGLQDRLVSASLGGYRCPLPQKP